MPVALVTPELLVWARERADLASWELAEKLKISEEKLLSWENGTKKPTINQAEALAKKLFVPLGWLHLDSPPTDDELPIPDLRTMAGTTKPLSANFRDFLSDILYKQEWRREYRQENGFFPLPFLGKFHHRKHSPQEVAADIQKHLHVPNAHERKSLDADKFLNLLISATTEIDIWVMRNSQVGNNTHRPLDVEEFRGLAIHDDLVPLVFINSRDSKSGQIFTLIHELAHLWIGESGISNPFPFDSPPPVEKFCNQVAAQFLVPDHLLAEQWNPDKTLSENADVLANYFCVSRLVIAFRAAHTQKLSWHECLTYYHQQKEEWKQLPPPVKRGKVIVPPAVIMPIRVGRKFLMEVLASAKQGTLLYRDAAHLLGTTLQTLNNLPLKLGVR